MSKMLLSRQVKYDLFVKNQFTCSCCGRKVPDIVLKAVKEKDENGNTIDISAVCYECDISDNSVPSIECLSKEKNQQIEMFFEWKQSLNETIDRSIFLLVDYINEKMRPYAVNERWIKRNAKKLLDKYDLSLLTDAIDKSAQTYLEYTKDGEVITESAEIYLKKISAIANNLSKPESERMINYKVNYIKKVCENRFVYFDSRKGYAILYKLVESLRNNGQSEESIIEFLEDKAIEFSKCCSNWSEWKSQMLEWISSADV